MVEVGAGLFCWGAAWASLKRSPTGIAEGPMKNKRDNDRRNEVRVGKWWRIEFAVMILLGRAKA
jgi:hypothetical protein